MFYKLQDIFLNFAKIIKILKILTVKRNITLSVKLI
jgi:hypothetical protein